MDSLADIDDYQQEAQILERPHIHGPFSPWPAYSEEEADAVRDLVLSNKVNYWTGTAVKTFEKEFAQFVGTEHGIGVSNGTVALDLILNALDRDDRDEIIVTPRTYIASASSIVLAGFKPVFVDVDRDSQNIAIDAVLRAITPKTRAIMAVHLAGWPCEMEALAEIATQHRLDIIEDCAQAHGATHNGTPVGGLGTAAAWSFCVEKIMTTGGEGGMVTTSNDDLYAKMWAYKDHGKSLDAVYNREHAPGFRWLHESFGSNLRMLEYQGVIGRIQLKRLHNWVATRQHNAARIWQAAHDIPAIRVPTIPAHIQHACYKCYVFLELDKLKRGWNRDRILREFEARGVPAFTGSCPEVYLEKAFAGSGFEPEKRLPVAQELGETSLMFMVHPTLSEAEITCMCDTLADVMNKAVK